MLADTGVARLNDLSLLTATAKALHLLVHSEKPFSYCTRLYKNFTWCTEIATLIHGSRNPASLDPTRAPFTTSGGCGFENNTFTALEALNYSPKDAPAPASAPAPNMRLQTTHPFEGDLRIDNSSRLARNISSSDSMDSMASNTNPVYLSSFPNSFDSDFFNNIEFFHKPDDMTNILQQSVEMAPESSAQFQDALKWVFDKGDGLGSSFQQIMTGG